MSATLAQILAQLGGLSQQERAALARAVLLSLEPEDPDAEDAWDKELARRTDRIRSGEAADIPAEQVLAEWRRRRSWPRSRLLP
jgi:putative addiction module component (TIGR02574 family)